MDPILKWHLEALFTKSPKSLPDSAPPPIEFWRQHGIAPYLYELGLELPSSWQKALHALVQPAAIAEGLSANLLSQTFDAFQRAGLKVLVVKGAALAQMLYPKPYTRVRCDADLWIKPENRAEVDALLRQSGWLIKPTLTGELVRHQQIYLHEDPFGHTHQLDLHWSLFDRPALRPKFDFDSFYARSMEMPGWAVRVPNWSDHFLILLMHLGGHHANQVRLIWLLDLWLLRQKLDNESRQKLQSQCSKRPLSLYADPPLQYLAFLEGERLDFPEIKPSHELQRVWDDLTSLSLPQKLVYLKELACPSRVYMQNRYDPSGQKGLLSLYLLRWRRALAYLRRR